MGEERMAIGALRAEIARAARIDDPVERALELVAAIDCIARPFGIRHEIARAAFLAEYPSE